MAEIRQQYLLDSNSVEAIQRVFNMLMDRLDALEGLRGTPTFYSDVVLTGTINIDASDVTGLGTLAVVNDAASDGNTYGRKNGAWAIPAPNTPASTVENEIAYGLSSAVGTDGEYARQDHTHGTPPAPFPVGSVYWNTTEVNPNTELGYGTWASRGVVEMWAAGTYKSVEAWERTA